LPVVGWVNQKPAAELFVKRLPQNHFLREFLGHQEVRPIQVDCTEQGRRKDQTLKVVPVNYLSHSLLRHQIR
jgi:hypothetical protein